MKKFLLLFSMIAIVAVCYADKGRKGDKKSKDKTIDSLTAVLFQEQLFRDSVTKVLHYEKGNITLNGEFATLNIPSGFKFLNPEQSNFVLTDLWGNPPQTGILGMIFPENSDPFTDSSYAFIISFDDMGYVKDKDAGDINYDDMLKDMQSEEAEINRERIAMGYPSIHTAGWAQSPFYDSKKNVLHWAKDLRFGDNPDHTLNYDIRILGRKGILSLNAVASMSELEMVKKDIDKVLTMASFTEGNRYSDYNSSTDKIAVYTVGGLVAGKVLAKVGFFAVLLKFGKFIVIGLVAVFIGIKKFFFGKKKQEEYVYEPQRRDDEQQNG
jgi:uncharacterized membrane-anchored protein